MTCGHSAAIAATLADRLPTAWAEVHADAQTPADLGEESREGRGAVGGSTVPRPPGVA